jgi:hypothetical protein
MADIYAENAAQARLIRHYENLWGYTHKATTDAIKEIRESCAVPEGMAEEEANEQNPVRVHLLSRADELADTLAAIEDAQADG